MFMAKFEKIWYVCVFIAAVGIVVFWVAGFTGHLAVSTTSFFGAGVFAVAAIIAKVLQYHHEKWYGCAD